MHTAPDEPQEAKMPEVNVNDDDQMWRHYGYTKSELFDMMMAGDDIGSYFDGDPIELFG